MKADEARELLAEINTQYAGRISATLECKEVDKAGQGWRVKVECPAANRREIVNYREQWEGIRDAWSLWIAPPTEPERYDRRARAQVLLYQLAEYQARLGPFHECGCPIWVPTKGGERCLRCWPPQGMPNDLRQRLNALVTK